MKGVVVVASIWAASVIALLLAFYVREIWLRALQRWPNPPPKWALCDSGVPFAFFWLLYLPFDAGSWTVCFADSALRRIVQRAATRRLVAEREEALRRELAEIQRHDVEQGPHR